MMARLDAMVLGLGLVDVVTMKLAGIVDAILDHGRYLRTLEMEVLG